MSFAEKIIAFNSRLNFSGSLPKGIRIMNPFKENPEAVAASEKFYSKFYDDDYPRNLILGINPGRLGAGVTGVPFTDPKRLIEYCGIPYSGKMLHEPSSAFMYEMIAAYGGVEKFYRENYIHSVCPLGFIIYENDKEKNYNYYDSKALLQAVSTFIEWNIKKQLEIGFGSEVCYCLGSGKNFSFLQSFNEKKNFFKKIVPLEHPRFITQYKQKEKEKYIADYLKKLERK